MKKKYEYVIDNRNQHLGGNFAEGDPATFSPIAWKFIIERFSIKSMLDIGSGRGYAAKWFLDQGLDVTAIEGLYENVINSVVPTIKHDLTISSYKKHVDFVNCIEVVEHIEVKFIDNLMDTLCNGKYVLITHAIPGQKGWHHVNCQPSEYWISNFEKRNFKFLHNDSLIIRKLAESDGGLHIARNGMIFKNESTDC
jgi:2-polyprenyl-3-methyl-5-hydroxy-6-metoxy-1,4-benzoquinol methylase